MELTARYNPSEIEDKWYHHWIEKGYFQSSPDDRDPYTIVIPPPNVTGVLHMGHMLNATIQDILIRKARLDGKNACWVPGTDHASIATEAKVVRWLKNEQGLTKGEIGREKFIDYAWEWTEKYGGIILKQLRKLGASCDWDRTAFTMDPIRSNQVLKVFVDLYRKGKIYRGYRMVNWDVQAKTVLSNEEVIYEEEKSALYYVRYPIPDSNEYLIVATTRPETIFGDTAIAVNPKDNRYSHLYGKHVVVPLTGRQVPIISDDYVDQTFGTGALKVTPAHDPNDYEIGLRHDLEIIDVINNDGSLNEHAGFLKGLSREEGRKLMVQQLDEAELIEKVEDYSHNVGRSERTHSVIEPRLSLQWYVNMKELAQPALENVMNDSIQFFPKNMKNTYRNWLENIRDWCISRQLWWGHRIPAYYYKNEVFVAETPEEALQQAKDHFQDQSVKAEDLQQDNDVLDTWFSSWLWPFSVFNGLESNDEVTYYYPTSVLVTAWDIIFLWVARMIIAGYEWKGEKPFKHVYFTGMVRDKQRRKMSKSLGNSPDALALITNYGADAVRFGLLSSSPAGGDLLFDEKLCEQGRNFCNKLWNALRLIKRLETKEANKAMSPQESIATEWVEGKFGTTLSDVNQKIEEYRLSDALITLHNFIWNDFCSWYLEMLKPSGEENISSEALGHSKQLFEKMMIVLHPFMPFITEELYQHVKTDDNHSDCVVSTWPTDQKINLSSLKRIEHIKEIVSKIRDLRNKHQLKQRAPLPLFTLSTELVTDERAKMILKDLAYLASFNHLNESPNDSNYVQFVIGTNQYYIKVPQQERDFEAEKEQLLSEISYQEGFVAQAQKKLRNKRFVQNAPEAVVAKEKQKLEDGLKRIQLLKESLEKLN